VVITFKGTRRIQVIEGQLVNGRAGDGEADVHKWLGGVLAARRDIRITEVGACLVGRGSVQSGDGTGGIKKTQKILCTESSK
jgi:hypothetical protein